MITHIPVHFERTVLKKPSVLHGVCTNHVITIKKVLLSINTLSITERNYIGAIKGCAHLL